MEEGLHSGAPAQLVRWAPLLAVALVCVWAAAVRWRADTRAPTLPIAGAMVTLAAAGAIHLLLVPSHAEESLASGIFFAASGLAELSVALAVWRGPSRVTFAIASAVIAGLFIVYGFSRLWSAPIVGPREAVDAIGLITKLLEVLAVAFLVVARRPSLLSLRIAPEVVAAATVVSVAVIVPPLVDLGPSVAQLAVSVVLSVAIVVARHGHSAAPSLVGLAIADGAVVALAVRADGVAPFVVGGLLAGGLRALGPRPLLAPAAAAALFVLAVPSLGGRYEILHVGHGAAVPSLLAFATGVVVTWVAWRRGRLAAVLGFYALHLGLQAARVLLGRTSVEAVEIPGASIGLALLVAVVMADSAVMQPRAWSGTAGAVAGGLDVVLRESGAAYPALIAIAVVTLLSGLRGLLLPARESAVTPAVRPLSPRPARSRWERASRGRPAST